MIIKGCPVTHLMLQCVIIFRMISISINRNRETSVVESTEFISIRKKLTKTQKELAELLGSSLKAVSSYEQGWRTIPGHVERQLLFLFSKKVRLKDQNCWDIIKCPPEKKENCPAWEFDSGNRCWFINGTICGQQPQKNWQEKISICRRCRVLKRLLKS